MKKLEEVFLRILIICIFLYICMFGTNKNIM
jgi:hypothetical protein